MSARGSLVLIAILLVAACSGESAPANEAVADSTSRNLTMPAPDSTQLLNDLPIPPAATAAPVPNATVRPAATTPASPATAPAPPPAPATHTLPVGTSVAMVANSAITSLTNKVGDSFTATVAAAILDGAGRTVLPAGAVVTLLIEAMAPAANRGDTTGTLRLRATAVSFGGERYDIDGPTTSVASTLKGRGVTTDAAAKVGAGAVVGAVAGRVLGGGRSGSVVGGVVGAATGAAIAAESADRDVVVANGARIVIALRQALTVPRD